MTDLINRLEFKAQSNAETNRRAGRSGPEWAIGAEIEWQAAQRLRRFETALSSIATCESHHPEDVVAIARKALAE